VGSDQLLLIKCLVPIVPQPLVERQRLNSLLEAGLRRKLTLVSAPAGFGKSTLVAAWATAQNAKRKSAARGMDETRNAHSTPQVAWVSLEVSDNTPSQFWMYAFTALERDAPEDARAALNAVQASQPAPLESILTAFINARLEHPVPGVLILDAYHVISDEAIHRSLGFLLEHLPPQMHVMLLSRSEPPLPLARLHANQARAAIASANALEDADTADLFTEVSRAMDKHLWFLEAHLQGSGTQPLAGVSCQHETLETYPEGWTTTQPFWYFLRSAGVGPRNTFGRRLSGGAAPPSAFPLNWAGALWAG